MDTVSTKKHSADAESEDKRRWDDTFGHGWLSLLAGVIRQAIEDLGHHDDEIRNSAIEFFYGENFESWCEIINIIPEYIRREAGVSVLGQPAPCVGASIPRESEAKYF